MADVIEKYGVETTVAEATDTETTAAAAETDTVENTGAKSLSDRYKEFTYQWGDPEPNTLTELLQSDRLIVLLEGALVAGLGLFLLCSPTSGILTQVIGSLVFLSGIVIVTL